MKRLTIPEIDYSAVGVVDEMRTGTIAGMLCRLAYYEDLEEQGRLVVLPCKVGDTVWGVVYDTRDCPNCVGIGGCFGCSKANPIDVYRTDFKLHMVEEIGRTLFLTRAEAEAAMEGEKT